jgi:fatty acid desaturase
MTSVFRYADGVWPNVLAMAWTILAYIAGVALLGSDNWMLNVLGFLLVAQTLIWSAYFIHEFAHYAIFKTPAANEHWGSVMSVINGSCFAKFSDMRKKHMRHHVERADVITFDVRGFLNRSPAWFRNSVLALEWAYFPAVEFLMRGFVMLVPFTDERKRAGRRRVLVVGALRLSAWIALGLWSLKALVLYFAAYLVFVTALRFADCFQHTYESYPVLDDKPLPADKLRDREYEQANTYSDIVGLKSGFLNLIWLNFGFHNAHHERPTAPWHRLPGFHKELYPVQYAQLITVGELLRSFHINRVKRVLAVDYGQVQDLGVKGRADGFLGAVGVSFLTAV